MLLIRAGIIVEGSAELRALVHYASMILILLPDLSTGSTLKVCNSV